MNKLKEMLNILKQLDKRIKYGVIGVLVLILIIVLLILFTPSTLKLTREEVLLDGFKVKEELKVKIGFNEIKNIKLIKEIEVSEYYDQYGTYYDSLEKVLNNAYYYLGNDYNLEREGNKIIVTINTSEDGVVLNNLTINYNGDDDTTLRYDAITDLNTESGIMIGDNTSKVELKDKLSKFGYQ
ncbi:MAG: hypothetical protein K2L98_01420 [Bacilli bacterium]|nr:hypothetical protein [Bacilli bacterium]